MSDAPPCVKCKYYVKPSFMDRFLLKDPDCRHPVSQYRQMLSPVTGKPYGDSPVYKSCDVMRVYGECGFEGVLFEPRAKA